MTDTLELYTVVFLEYDGRFLLLERAKDKAYAPGMWTGVGGRIERSEMADVAASALREVQEETGIAPDKIERFALRRVVLFQLREGPFRLLFYYTGTLATPAFTDSREGTLHWLHVDKTRLVDLVDSTRRTLPLLLDDMTSDPDGERPPTVGIARYDAGSKFEALVWL